VVGIAERIEEFQAFGESSEARDVRKLAAGEFRSGNAARRISYRVKLREPDPSEVAHISWVAGDRGFLMFSDLLPVEIKNVSAAFVLPGGWSIASSIEPDTKGWYEVLEPEKSVFLIGQSLHQTSKSVEGMRLETVLSGTWAFKNTEALNAANRVMKKYVAMTGHKLRQKSVVMIAPFPFPVTGARWSAETRGATVILLMNPKAEIKNWKGQLGVIFTHELLHLWVPNALKIEGDYDWFFEGFTSYIALRTALELKIINFKEFLDTLARVYDSCRSHSEKLSLIEASERRWTSRGSFVYDKGMLVAFLYDLKVREESAGKVTLADRYRDLFNGGVTEHAQGNEAIINVLGSSPALKGFAKAYIESSSDLDLEQVLPVYGLQLNTNGKSSQLRVGRDLDTNQERLLRSLGYRG
jgi:predicted metalloprotease with PDZ domain